MVYGHGVLDIVEGIRDQYVHLNVLKECLLVCKEKIGLDKYFYFYQDSDAKHNPYNVRSDTGCYTIVCMSWTHKPNVQVEALSRIC